MDSNKKIARMAGLWYLLFVIFGAFGTMYVDSAVYVSGDAEATAGNILASGSIFRLGLAVAIAGYVCFLLTANALYKLFKPTDSHPARLMLIFVIVGVSISILSKTVSHSAVLLLLNGSEYLSTFDASQRHALAMMFFDVNKHVEMILSVFSGLWLLPTGLLILKSGLIPKVIGMLLIVACFCWIADALVFILFPNSPEIIRTALHAVVSLAEVSFILWLLIKGVKSSKQ
jgi:hypothetical protein